MLTLKNKIRDVTVAYYSDGDIQRMRDKFLELKAQYEGQLTSVVSRKFRTVKGDEFAKHGFLRRCKMMWRCIERTFETLPPESNAKPSRDETMDVTIFLHCFVIHVFGACDDLAWILVHEKEITKQDGNELPPAWIGLRKSNTVVRDRMSTEMIEVLDGLEEWFQHIENFRHSLAHRIPLYVPPYLVPHDQEDEYYRLEKECREALASGDIGNHQRLQEEQEALTFFRPWFTHSFSEEAPHVVIHPQMLADFGAVLELGKATFNEVD